MGGMVEARIAGMAQRVLSGELLDRSDAEHLAAVSGDDFSSSNSANKSVAADVGAK